MHFSEYSPVLGALLDTAPRNALIQNEESLLLWPSPVALTRHGTYNFLTLDCRIFCRPFLKQSSLSLRVGLCCCWSYIYWHSVATVEDYQWLVHSHLKEKQLDDHYSIHIHVHDRLLTNYPPRGFACFKHHSHKRLWLCYTYLSIFFLI